MLYLFKKNKSYLISLFLMIFYAIVFLLVMIIIIDPDEKKIAFDKLQHFSAFSILTYFVFFILSYQDKIFFLKIHRTAITEIFALAIGVSIEIVQLYMPNRTSSIYDVMADLWGILFTIFIIKYSPNRIKNLKKYGI